MLQSASRQHGRLSSRRHATGHSWRPAGVCFYACSTRQCLWWRRAANLRTWGCFAGELDRLCSLQRVRTRSLLPGQVTVSTVGVVPRIRALAVELPGVSLALSLHAPNQALRQRIVPSARAYPLERLMAAVAEYQAASGMRVRSACGAGACEGRLVCVEEPPWRCGITFLIISFLLSGVAAHVYVLL